MATQNSQGIHTLLEAEKEASKIVTKARQYRVQRLKDARTEAQKEIEALKAQKQAEYAAFEKSHLGTNDHIIGKFGTDAEEKLKEIKNLYEANKEEVLQNLINNVISVTAELHPNYKFDS